MDYEKTLRTRLELCKEHKLNKLIFLGGRTNKLYQYKAGVPYREGSELSLKGVKRGQTEEEAKSSQVNTLPKAKSKTRSKQNKDMHKCSSVYSERGVPLPDLTSGGE